MKLTVQGIKSTKDAPQWIEKGIKAYEAIGGKVLAFYSVQGEYDYVAIYRSPNDAVAMGFLLSLGTQGNVRTTTLRAFTREEFAAVVEKLP
jgi:uncharacterized protein with GYD domain